MRQQPLVVNLPATCREKTSRVTEEEAESRRLRVQTSDFGELYNLYHRRVFSWCLRIVRNADDAEDLTQDTFLHLFRKIGTFRGESAFTTWLYRLTTNIALMRMRRKIPVQISLDEISETDQTAARPRHEIQAWDRALASSILRADLDRALNKVPRGFRKALFLHDGEQFTHEEIAELTGCAVGTSKSQLHKARQRVRQLLTSRCACVEGRN